MIMQPSTQADVLDGVATSDACDRESSVLRVEHADSGVESSDESCIMDADTITAIVTQVEGYFSDENLRKDAFFLKHVKRNRDGYVSLKLIASLRRIKSLAKNWKDVAAVVRQKSQLLELNEEGNKVKRNAALPVDLLLLSRGKRIVLAHDLPNNTAAAITQSFAGYGNIVSIRLLGHQEDDETIAKTYPSLRLATSALVEYESATTAEKAVRSIQRNLTSWRSSFGAVLFGEPILSRRSSSQAHVDKGAEASRTGETGRQRSQTMWTNSFKEGVSPLQRKSRSYNAFDAANFMRATVRSGIYLHRQPFGPDGTRGFQKKRLITF